MMWIFFFFGGCRFSSGEKHMVAVDQHCGLKIQKETEGRLFRILNLTKCGFVFGFAFMSAILMPQFVR